MQRTTAPGHVNNLFVEEDVNIGRAPTQITALWMNSVQEEICSVIEATSIELDHGVNNQLLSAINSLISTAIATVNEASIGDIKMWGKAIALIPIGWQLCDGTNGTPDLRDKFIIGASADSADGKAKTNITGALTKTGGSKNAVVVNHTHDIDDHTHDINDPGHIHDNNQPASDSQTPGGAYPASSGSVSLHKTEIAYTDITILDASLSVSPTGVSGINANLPPYYALAFIMRVS